MAIDVSGIGSVNLVIEEAQQQNARDNRVIRDGMHEIANAQRSTASIWETLANVSRKFEATAALVSTAIAAVGIAASMLKHIQQAKSEQAINQLPPDQQQQARAQQQQKPVT